MSNLLLLACSMAQVVICQEGNVLLYTWHEKISKRNKEILKFNTRVLGLDLNWMISKSEYEWFESLDASKDDCLSMQVSSPMDLRWQSKRWKQVCKVLFKPSTFCRFRSWIISRFWPSTFVSSESRTYNSKPSNSILWFYSFWKDYTDQKSKNKDNFSGPSSNENSSSSLRITWYHFFLKSIKRVSGESNYFWMFLGSNRLVSIWPCVNARS